MYIDEKVKRPLLNPNCLSNIRWRDLDQTLVFQYSVKFSAIAGTSTNTMKSMYNSVKIAEH